jgi:hypothetical protein
MLALLEATGGLEVTLLVVGSRLVLGGAARFEEDPSLVGWSGMWGPVRMGP